MKIENRTSFAVEALPVLNTEGNPNFLVVVKGTFSIGGGGTVAPAEEQIPVAFGEVLDGGGDTAKVRFESDTVPFKPRADVFLLGKAHAPGGKPVRWLDAGLSVGNVKKVVRVFGDRSWISGQGRLSAPIFTEPEPFTEMELVDEKSFGGIDTESGGVCAENPAGCGFYTRKSPENIDRAPLPNIEDPGNPIRQWKDHPRPTGFGIVGKHCQPRLGYLGTYDERWRKERCPAPPADFRPDHYNAAQADLQVPGYLKGDEEVLLLNLTPGGGEVRFRLADVRPAVTLIRADIEFLGWDAPPSTEHLDMRLDTLCLLPEENRFFLVWRGSLPVRNLGALEIREVLVQG
ncbi:DUF2169 domain-containing protein [Candidatus Deferrimicrobium sp.]|uniref:DUF2169 family type VI secretion system accessory protein n=1 Tax=Candidatus Deferrimicrobium sp. TaxID=3060586 RepID=UPI002717B399|nr:DUF2169 domain-containing protein [Candidatus Deferrimicrobium sp.]MDO8738851.1 DUF2169 domain-containing protein [Candidatus Deferrimicrobium sp.]